MKQWRIGACLALAFGLIGGLTACDGGGTTMVDSGPEPVDAGPPGEDAGPPEEDAGPVGGPIDGVWQLTATQCNGAEAASPPYELTINDDAGTFVLTLTAECRYEFDESYTYGDSSITITPNSVMCIEEAACMMIPMAPPCDMTPPPITFDYELGADGSLTFTKTSLGPAAGDPCPEGETVTFVMSPATSGG